MKLKKKNRKKKTLFRLKDWGISRQRYWGCPIPMIYLEDGSVVPVDKSELPVELPDDIDLNSQGNPLDNHPTWKNTIQKSTGKKAIRETDTLDTFVDSSWYFLRFCSPKIKLLLLMKKKLIIGCLLINTLVVLNMQYYIYFIQDFLLKVLKKLIKKLIFLNLLKIYLLKEWFVMKLIKIKMEIGLS